jgi:hypothetical protein
VKWETHATPVTGQRPQETINSQLIRDGDILIVMFWTKLGSPTGIAESGTAEEIKEFVTAGKPAMIYFSSRPIDPSLIDTDQLNKLKAFKSDTYKNALVAALPASISFVRSCNVTCYDKSVECHGCGRTKLRLTRLKCYVSSGS